MTLKDLTKEEIIMAKELIKGRTLLSLEDSYSVASFYGAKLLLENKISSPEETLKHIEAVTEEEIVNVARELFVPERLNFAIISPFEKGEFSEKDFALT
ncbi:insulinase family protein [Candidatus Roizmanbacteria bacterium]|nr:insulinase family protein [Candidatus Roizmanbacteria bacterium]